MRFSRTIASLGAAAALLFIGATSAQSASAVTQPSVQADTTAPHDPIARLQARINAGELTLPYDTVRGYLPGLLRALKIPESSQGLVFSRTSLRGDLIAPWSPRALYFNDDVYVGWVQGSEFLEIASVSAAAGAVFYTLNQEQKARPTFDREGSTCLMCHKSRTTGGVPGFLVSSIIPDRLGYPITTIFDGSTTDETPIKQRFGGWYVTGSLGAAVHSGNVYSPKDFHQVDKAQYRTQFDMTTESARADLTGKFDATPYLNAHSDLVAMMVLVHQVSLHNLISTTQAVAKTALLEDAVSDRFAAASKPVVPLAVSHVKLRSAVERLVQAMLFVGAAPLEAPMRGTTSFTIDFAKQGPRDPKGRSLRDFDLQQRLFKYPLSFLIYSEGFDSMPLVAKAGVYQRLRSILSGEDASAEFAKIAPEDRKAILEILTATKPEFAKLGAK